MKAILAGASAIVVLALAACGSSGGGQASPTPTPGRGGNGASGKLVQINGRTLILTDPASGTDTTVTFSDSTTIDRRSTAQVADITTGSCIFVSGTKDPQGALLPTNVQVSPKTGTSCQAGFGGGRGPGASPGAGPPNSTPRPNFSPPANAAFVSGEVTAVKGTTITVQPATGDSQSIAIPTTVVVNRIQAAAASDLAVGQCVQARGQKDPAGSVVATSLTITPANASGTCAGGGRGRGPGGGGGGRPGGGGAGGPGG